MFDSVRFNTGKNNRKPFWTQAQFEWAYTHVHFLSNKAGHRSQMQSASLWIFFGWIRPKLLQIVAFCTKSLFWPNIEQAHAVRLTIEASFSDDFRKRNSENNLRKQLKQFLNRCKKYKEFVFRQKKKTKKNCAVWWCCELQSFILSCGWQERSKMKRKRRANPVCAAFSWSRDHVEMNVNEHVSLLMFNPRLNPWKRQPCSYSEQ